MQDYYSYRVLKIFLIILLLFSLIRSAVSADWHGTVVNFHDGDTLIVSEDGRARIIRLFGVDCPEKVQPYGLKAKEYASNIASGKKIDIVDIDEKRYSRCIVYVDDLCLNEALLKAGFAWHDEQCSSDERWSALEKKARESKLGLWSQNDPVPPWEIRSEKEVNAEVQYSKTIKMGGRHPKETVPIHRAQRRHSRPQRIQRPRR